MSARREPRPRASRAPRAVRSCKAATPRAWVDAALADLPTLLVDHANCEKKAASTAMALIFAYPEDRALSVALSRLAREELKHFEQVERLMRKLDVPYQRMKPGRYASELRKLVRTHEPKRKLDLMIVHALIEARSCERFRLLARRLPEEVRDLYEQLERSEARHFEIYLDFARARISGRRDCGAAGVDRRARGGARHRARHANCGSIPARRPSDGSQSNAAAGPRARRRASTATQLAASYQGASTTRSALHAIDHARDESPGDACARGSAAARRWRARRATPRRDSRP